MSTSRLRMLAGPNGSGKSTLLHDLRKLVHLGYWLNADEVEAKLLADPTFDFAPWNLQIEQFELQNFVHNHGLASHLPRASIIVQENKLVSYPAFYGGYFASVLCDFLRHKWIETGQNFTFETVMSHASKIDLVQEARTKGYRTYLYFVCTDSPLINQERVKSRVALGGHAVPPEKIVERYQRCVALLYDAILASNRAYLFDNSAKGHRLIAEFADGVLLNMTEDQPNWCVENVLAKLTKN